LVQNRIPVFEPKNKEFELEFRLLVPPTKNEKTKNQETLHKSWSGIHKNGILVGGMGGE